MYHHILPTKTEHSVTPEQFREQLLLLKSKGYSFVNAEHITQDQNVLDKKTIAITFDDGWLDNWAFAIPILNELQIPATIFVITAWPQEGEKRTIEQVPHLNTLTHSTAMQHTQNNEHDNVIMRWSELAALSQNPLISIQCHSHEHGENWLKLNDIAAIKNDLQTSKLALKNKLNINATHLCWPRGKFTPESYKAAYEEGFEFQYSTIKGTNNSNIFKRKAIRRLNVSNIDADELLRAIQYASLPILGSIMGSAHKLKVLARLKAEFKFKNIIKWTRL